MARTVPEKMYLKPGLQVTLAGAPDPAHGGLDALPPPRADGGVALVTFYRDMDTLQADLPARLEALPSEALVWIAYPKGGTLGTDLKRDLIWPLTESWGWRPVAQVALDDTWTAMRVRRG